MQMTEVRALNRDAAKQQPESVFETPVCTENLKADVLVMKSANDGV
jgi:hypothetical protein